MGAQLHDILNGGLRLRLMGRSDVHVGPWQMEFPQQQELGEAVVSLQHRVLPWCAPVPPTPCSSGCQEADAGARRLIRIEGVGHGASLDVGQRPPWWETPVLT